MPTVCVTVRTYDHSAIVAATLSIHNVADIFLHPQSGLLLRIPWYLLDLGALPGLLSSFLSERTVWGEWRCPASHESFMHMISFAHFILQFSPEL
jgi:hypothetical protein